MQLMWRNYDGRLRILLWSPEGDVIPSSEAELFSLTCPGDAELISVEAVDSEISELKTNIIQNSTRTHPSEFVLCQNYPNPFNPQTKIKYSVAEGQNVKLAIYNVLGQRVKTLVDEYQTAGHKLAHWDGKDENENEMSSGVYFYRIEAGALVQTRKMVLLR